MSENRERSNQETTEREEREHIPEPSAQESEVSALQEQSAQLNDQLLRVLAEYDNYRKRACRERESIYPQAVSDTVRQILPVIDSFERAMESECRDAEFKKGMEMIYSSLMDALSKLSVEQVGAVGEEFDPELHDAVMHTEDEALGANVIAQVMQKGYKMGDKVIRHAMVQVAN